MKVHKIREKCNHDNVVTVVGKSNTHYLVNNDASNTVYALPISQWEDVPQDRWQDVTGECEVSVGLCAMLHNGWVVQAANGYRLRKVQSWVGNYPAHGKVWAFIVERKVSE